MYLLRELHAHVKAGLVDGAAIHDGVRAREVHVLEDTGGEAGGGVAQLRVAVAGGGNEDNLAGVDVTYELGGWGACACKLGRRRLNRFSGVPFRPSSPNTCCAPHLKPKRVNRHALTTHNIIQSSPRVAHLPRRAGRLRNGYGLTLRLPADPGPEHDGPDPLRVAEPYHTDAVYEVQPGVASLALPHDAFHGGKDV